MTKDQLHFKCGNCKRNGVKTSWAATEDEKQAIRKYYEERVANKETKQKRDQTSRNDKKPAVRENKPPSSTSHEKPKQKRSLFGWEDWL